MALIPCNDIDDQQWCIVKKSAACPVWTEDYDDGDPPWRACTPQVCSSQYEKIMFFVDLKLILIAHFGRHKKYFMFDGLDCPV